ncbi:MAG: FAD-dependent thymidylate synthase [Synergistaceae bacterium]|nr:FAD-dependent thymidylate synthase [Synergistaceae bacterium]MBQ3759107.1 FAD-dependent thymidylate synthase [Synergistaceae bacterium]
MKVTLIANTANAEELCGQAAAVSTNTNNIKSALRSALESGHTSILEHAVYTFRVEGLSRAALAQLTRHRLASFVVQSQRYVKLKDAEMVMPESIASSGFKEEAKKVMALAFELYQRMTEAGIPYEDARYVIPQAVETTLVMTMNARELLHFFSLRICNRAQWEIRRLAEKMLKLCRQSAPLIFGKAGPGCVRGHCPEKKPCGRKNDSEN